MTSHSQPFGWWFPGLLVNDRMVMAVVPIVKSPGSLGAGAYRIGIFGWRPGHGILGETFREPCGA